MGGMDTMHALGLAPGAEVGGYRLICRLGGGAMGTVWRVADGAGHQYAMKILRDSLFDEQGGNDVTDAEVREAASARERLRREAIALRKINHPGVCQIVDLELDDALAFIVTEFIDGGTLLTDVADNGRYVVDDLERLARKLMDAVHAVHAAGIIHRDIKPANVMIAATGPILVDFGIAMGQDQSHVTRTGLVMGTPGFIAPEIIDGAESSKVTDWWSLASVLAFAATGKAVFGTKPMMAVLEREAHGNPNLGGLPERTASAFRTALAPDPTARCTPLDLLKAIHEDAQHPELWASDDETDNPEQTSVMHPFDLDSTTQDGVMPARPATSYRTQWNDSPAIAFDDIDDMEDETATAVATQVTVDDESDEETAALTSLAPTTLAPTQTATLTPRPTIDGDLTQTDPAVMMTPPALSDIPTQAAPVVPQPQQQLATIEHVYAKRGSVVLILLTVPVALTAASMPLISLLVAAVLLWLLLTVGFNTQAHLERLTRNAGRRSRGEPVVRTVTLPWHILKSLAVLIVRVLFLALTMLLVVVLSVVSLQLATVHVEASVFGWHVTPLLLADGPFSLSGLVLASGMAIGWILVCFGPYSLSARIGAGAIRGVDTPALLEQHFPDFSGSDLPLEGTSEAYENGELLGSDAHSRHRPSSRRRWALWLCWLTLTLAALSVLLAHMNTGVNWWPIMLA